MEIFLKYSEVADTNFKSKGLVVEWKLAARKSFEKMILCRGSTNSPIDIHKSSLELSHLFRATSLDSCLTQNHNFYWKLRNMQTNQDTEILILRALNQFLRCILTRNILRKGFFLKGKTLFANNNTQGSNKSNLEEDKISK